MTAGTLPSETSPSPPAFAGASRRPWVAIGVYALAIGFVALAGGLTVLQALSAKFDHDEHQFVAPAILLVRGGELPYLGYQYLHTPLAGLIYAPAALLPWPFLGARIITGLLGVALLAMVFHFGRRTLGGTPAAALAAAGLVVLLAGAPASYFALGATWNHASSVSAAVAAFLLMLHGTRTHRSWIVAASGLALGLAISLRLTAAPLLAPFGLGLLFLGTDLSVRRVLTRIAFFGGGVFVGMLPISLCLAAAPESFLVGNFVYPRLSTEFHRQNDRVWDWGRKLTTFREQADDSWKHTALLWLPVGSVVAAIAAAAARRRDDWRDLAFAVLVLAFVAFGSYMPGRLNLQYNFAPIVFATLVVLVTLGMLVRRGLPAWALAAAGFALAVAVFATDRDWLAHPRYMLDTSRWGTTEVARASAALGELAQGRPVLTLDPLFPMLAGSDCPSEFVNGPFLWRTAALADKDRRSRLNWVGPEELPAVVEAMPQPVLFLTGNQEKDGLDAPIEAFAQARGYRPAELPMIWANGKRVVFKLWLPPGE